MSVSLQELKRLRKQWEADRARKNAVKQKVEAAASRPPRRVGMGDLKVAEARDEAKARAERQARIAARTPAPIPTRGTTGSTRGMEIRAGRPEPPEAKPGLAEQIGRWTPGGLAERAVMAVGRLLGITPAMEAQKRTQLSQAPQEIVSGYGQWLKGIPGSIGQTGEYLETAPDPWSAMGRAALVAASVAPAFRPMLRPRSYTGPVGPKFTKPRVGGRGEAITEMGEIAVPSQVAPTVIEKPPFQPTAETVPAAETAVQPPKRQYPSRKKPAQPAQQAGVIEQRHIEQAATETVRYPSTKGPKGGIFAAEGVGGAMKTIVKEVRELQTQFLREKGLTWEQAQALAPAKRQALQGEYEQWFSRRQGSAPAAAEPVAPAGVVASMEQRYPIGADVEWVAPGSLVQRHSERGTVIGYKTDPVTGSTFLEVRYPTGRVDYAGAINDVRLIRHKAPAAVAPAAPPAGKQAPKIGDVVLERPNVPYTEVRVEQSKVEFLSQETRRLTEAEARLQLEADNPIATKFNRDSVAQIKKNIASAKAQPGDTVKVLAYKIAGKPGAGLKRPAPQGPAPAAPTAGKQPWEMSQEEYVEPRFETQRHEGIAKGYRGPYVREHERSVLSKLVQEHQDAVDTALAEGKPVPATNRATWMRTQKEYVTDQIRRAREARNPEAESNAMRQVTIAAHRQEVEFALREGRPVPPEVLADYPDLQPKGAPVAPPAAEQPLPETGGFPVQETVPKAPKGRTASKVPVQTAGPGITITKGGEYATPSGKVVKVENIVADVLYVRIGNKRYKTDLGKAQATWEHLIPEGQPIGPAITKPRGKAKTPKVSVEPTPLERTERLSGLAESARWTGSTKEFRDSLSSQHIQQIQRQTGMTPDEFWQAARQKPRAGGQPLAAAGGLTATALGSEMATSDDPEISRAGKALMALGAAATAATGFAAFGGQHRLRLEQIAAGALARTRAGGQAARMAARKTADAFRSPSKVVPEIFWARLGGSKTDAFIHAARGQTTIDRVLGATVEHHSYMRLVDEARKAGIKKGSKAAGIVQRLLEGKAEAGEYGRLTDKQKALVPRFGEAMNELAGREGLTPEQMLDMYAPHVWDPSLKPRLRTPAEIREGFLSDRPPRSIRDPHMEQRKGAPDYEEDIILAYETRVRHALRRIHYDPVADEMANRIAAIKDPVKQRYAEAWWKGILGYENIDPTFTNVTSAITGRIYAGALRYNVASSLVNLTQTVLGTWSDLGTKWSAIGAKQLATAKGRNILKAAKVIPEYSAGRTGPLDSLRSGDFMQAAEFPNRGIAYLGARAKVLAEGKSPDAGHQAGVEMVRKTQYFYGMSGIDTPRVLANPVGRVLGQFASYPIKTTEFIAGMVGESFRNPKVGVPKLARFLGATTVLGGPTALIPDAVEQKIMEQNPLLYAWLQNWRRKYSVSGRLGVSLEAKLGWGVFPSGPAPAVSAMQHLGQLAEGISRDDADMRREALRQLRSRDLPLMFPGGVQAKKIGDALLTWGRGFKVYYDDGRLRRRVEPDELLRSAFLGYPQAWEQDWKTLRFARAITEDYQEGRQEALTAFLGTKTGKDTANQVLGGDLPEFAIRARLRGDLILYRFDKQDMMAVWKRKTYPSTQRYIEAQGKTQLRPRIIEEMEKAGLVRPEDRPFYDTLMRESKKLQQQQSPGGG